MTHPSQLPVPIKDKVESRVIREDRGYGTKCWVWQGATDRDGYPHMQVRIRPGVKRLRRAQRVVHEEYLGPIPEGYEVDHLCHVIQCLNPEHLEAVTPEENLRRRRIKTKTDTHCSNGHDAVHRNAYGHCKMCKREATARYRSRLRGGTEPLLGIGKGSRLVTPP